MNATSLRDTIQLEPRSVALFAMNVDGETCTVRGTTVWPIAEVLDYEQQLDGLAAGTFVDGDATVDAALIVDVLDSRVTVTLPSWVVSAITVVPGGAHPSYAHGYSERDNDFYQAWEEISRDRETFDAWMQANIHGAVVTG